MDHHHHHHHTNWNVEGEEGDDEADEADDRRAAPRHALRHSHDEYYYDVYLDAAPSIRPLPWWWWWTETRQP